MKYSMMIEEVLFRIVVAIVIILGWTSCCVYCSTTDETTGSTNLDANRSNINHQKYENDIQKRLELFHYSEDLHVLGPTKFPKPTDIFKTIQSNENDAKDAKDDNDDIIVVPYIKPIHGKHRPNKDALVAFAAEYPLLNYISFIESLRDANYTGDIVLSISILDVQKEDVWTYLTNADDPKRTTGTTTGTTGSDEEEDENGGLRVILYANKLTCYNAEQEQVDSFKGGSRVCYGHELYATKDPTTSTLKPLQDPRISRTVQTLRYELYWIMCQEYKPYSWIFIVDARDSVFQSNPFEHVPRRQQRQPQRQRHADGSIMDTEETGGGGGGGGGLIYMFGENVNATRLGKSKSNSKWLQAAYGDVVGNEWLADKPTICSGATMGEWIALETYLRAMVAEADYTGVVLAGADQGFHNYLHYSHKLKNAVDTIAAIVVFDQGQGIVNNMGAMRIAPLESWGNGNILHTVKDEHGKTTGYIVQNWDGTPSPVVHQFDRFKELSKYFFKQRGEAYVNAWNEKKLKEKTTNNTNVTATS